jgi:hypothetical protein
MAALLVEIIDRWFVASGFGGDHQALEMSVL